MTDRDDLKMAHELDQLIAEALAMCNLQVVGQDGQGRDLMELTAKGVTRTSLAIIIECFIERADDEKRDFTSAEKQEIVGYLQKAITTLQKEDQQ